MVRFQPTVANGRYSLFSLAGVIRLSYQQWPKLTPKIHKTNPYAFHSYNSNETITKKHSTNRAVKMG